MSGVGTRERIGVAVAVLAIVLAYAWSGHYWLDVVDEGYFVDLSQRVLDGAIPYRDFDTYYTPGIFYLFALAFKVFGTNLLVIRYLMALLRGVCALLLYGLTRRVAPGPLAWLPLAIVLLLDEWPVQAEPHPSWPAIAACLLTMELVARHLHNGRLRWLALAGATAGVAYLFKQNIGAFTALGVAGYVLLRARAGAGVITRLLQIGFALATVALVTLLMRQEIDVLSAGALWLPLVVALGLLTSRAMRASSIKSDAVWMEATVAGAVFSVVTLAWLLPLVLSIGPAQTPFGLFVGEVNQAAITTPFAAFTQGIPVVLLGVTWAVALLTMPRSRPLRVLPAGAIASGLILLLPGWQGPRDPLTFDPQLFPVVSWLDVSFGTLHLYLASLAVWAGIAAMLTVRDPTHPLPYFVLFGALANLTMYPRADMLHAVVSAPPALVAGASALARFSRSFKGWRRLGVLGALLAVPTLAVAPWLAWRAATIISPPIDGKQLRLEYAPLNIPQAPLLVPLQMADDFRGLVGFLDAGTQPGEPVFVYPAAPLLNFLADRPNPTRWDHYLPGTLDPGQLTQAATQLRDAQPRYVVWDQYGVDAWGTEPANALLSDYIQACYHEVASFGSYLVLEHNGADATGCGPD